MGVAANIGLTFEGLTDTTLYGQFAAINTFVEEGYTFTGFADDWHKLSPPVIMG